MLCDIIRTGESEDLVPTSNNGDKTGINFLYFSSSQICRSNECIFPVLMSLELCKIR